VDHLVLLCPALPPWLPDVRPSKFQVSSFGPFLLPGLGPMLMKRRIRRMSFEEQYRAMMEGLVPDPDVIPERMVSVGVANLSRVKELRWRGAAFGEATTGLFRHQLGPGRARTIQAMEQVTAPTLYVRGADDPLVLAATTSMVERVRPDWTIEEPEGIGHVPMIEAPQWTAERIITFVRGASVTRLRAG
jgi:pimeloyl-ACP methyl ester carboxylesterase